MSDPSSRADIVNEIDPSLFPDLERSADRLRRLLDSHPTPAFIGDREILLDRYHRLESALKTRCPRWEIAYSFKTNYLVAESGFFKDEGGLAEVVSGREYEMAKSLGYQGSEIIFNGPCKTDEQIVSAIRDGARIHVNDVEELERIRRIAAGEERRVPIGLRVSGTVGDKPRSRFGFSLDDDEAFNAIESLKECRSLRLAALHLHVLSDADDPALFGRACRMLRRFLCDRVPDILSDIKYLDLGGGFPSHGLKPKTRETYAPRPIEEYIDAIVDELSDLLRGSDSPSLLLEPGRYLVNDGIAFVSRVLRVQETPSHQIVTGDGSITMLPLTHYTPHRVQAFRSDFSPKTGDEKSTIVYGPSCREDDLLYVGALTPVQVGDCLVYYAVGAYNSNLSPDFIFQKPPLLFL